MAVIGEFHARFGRPVLPGGCRCVAFDYAQAERSGGEHRPASRPPFALSEVEVQGVTAA